MSRVILIGVGGLDADLLRVYGPSLPNMRRLMLESPFLELRSTIPPEPVPAWASVYTGLNPANHGVLAKMDCLERTFATAQTFKGELLWEKAARAGKRVCVLNPLLRGSGAAIAGLSIPSSATPDQPGSPDAFPVLLDEPQIPLTSQLAAFCTALHERTEQQANLALQHFGREPWDLFFAQFDALDHVQHFLWRYSDPGDPMYPGQNEHASRILNFYRLFDQIVGRFHAAMTSDCILAVVSSHGHERRCTYRMHVNEWLREQNFLAPEGQVRGLTLLSRRSPTPLVLLHTFYSRLLQRFSRLRKRSARLHDVDQKNSIASMVELASTTSSYGGIALNRELIEHRQMDYEQVRESIRSNLEQFSFEGKSIVNWARRREECYKGEQIACYPDILFELRSDFGVGRSIYLPLIIPDSTHRLISGAHSEHGVLLLENWSDRIEMAEDLQNPSVIDVAPTILRLLDIECTMLDGQPLVHPRAVKQLI